MSNSLLIACYILLAIKCFLIITVLLTLDKNKRLAHNLMFLEAMLLGWLSCLIILYTSQSHSVISFFHHLSLPFAMLATLATYLFVMRFYNLKMYYTKGMVAILCVIPAITLLLCLNGRESEYIFAGFEVVATSPTVIVSSTRNLWYWMQEVYCYTILVFAFVSVLSQYRSIPTLYRRSSQLVLFSLFLTIAGDVATLLPLRTYLDISLVFGCACTILLYFAIRNNQGLDFLMQARSKVFDELEAAIFILDDEETIIYQNSAALRLLDTMQAPPLKFYPRLLHHFFQEARREILQDPAHDGTDYIMPLEKGGIIYNLKEKEIHDHNKNKIGAITIITDATQNRHRLKELEESAGMDALTGLLNRTKIEEKLHTLSADPDALPIVVIVGDLNNLKQVNDTYGHAQGDFYLRLVSETLISLCPPNSFISRTGGDEFLILIPNYSMDRTTQLISRIQSYLLSLRGPSFKPSIALGACVYDDSGETLEQVINRADAQMYFDKKQKKASEAQASRDL